MSNFIQKLREKPEAHRKKVAIVFSTAVAGIVFVGFLILFLGDFSQYLDTKAQEPEKESELSKISESYKEYKKAFDESELAKQMEGASFTQNPQNETTNATMTATTTTPR